MEYIRMINYSEIILKEDSLPYTYINARYMKTNVEIDKEIKRMHILHLNIEKFWRGLIIFDNFKIGERVYFGDYGCDYIISLDIVKCNQLKLDIKEFNPTLYLKIITDLEDIIIIDEGRIVEIYHQLRHKDELILPTELILEYETKFNQKINQYNKI